MEHYWLLITILYTCLHSQIRDSPSSLKKRKKLKLSSVILRIRFTKEDLTAFIRFHIYYRD